MEHTLIQTINAMKTVTLHFRDYLNDNENMALQYQRVKEELESKYADDRVAYTNGKQEMIDVILNGK